MSIPGTRDFHHGLLGLSWCHRSVIVPHQQPLRPPHARLAPEPTPDVLEQDVPAVPIGQRLMVEQDTPVAVPTEGCQGERLVIS